MRVYSIIVTYNAVSHLEGCIGGLLSSEFPTTVVVIDNASTDDSVESIKRDYPEVILLSQEKNLGFGRANNVGISYALEQKADYFFLLNQDAYVYADTIGNLIGKFENKDHKYGILSPIHLNTEGDKLDYAWKGYYLTSESCPEYFRDLESGTLQDVYPVNFVNAASWMISSECIRSVGGFNSFFFMYAEDDDYIKRLFYKGFQLGFCPDSKVRHLRQEKVNKSEYLKSKNYLIRKFYFGSAALIMDPSKSMISVFMSLSWMSAKRSFWFLRKLRLREFLFHLFLPIRILVSWSKLKRYKKESCKSELAHLTS